MLEDLVGMVQGLDGDDDIELGSDYPYQNTENCNRGKKPNGGVPSTATSYEFKNKIGSMEDLEMQKMNKADDVSHNIVQ
jgi:hypothetical protein